MNLINVQDFNFFTLVTKLVPGGRIYFEELVTDTVFQNKTLSHHHLVFKFHKS
jgi:hypothetical protein